MELNRKVLSACGKTLKHLFLITASIVCIFPFYWMVVGATNTSANITKGTLLFGPEFFNNIKGLLEDGNNIFQAFGNTAVITVIQCVLVIFICSLAGYGFEKYRSKVRDRLFSVFLLTMMIPFAAIMIPLFNLMFDFSLIDTKLSVIVASLSNTFLIFFFRQSFKSFPTEIMEAARIDGAGELFIFFRIAIPPMKSTFAAAFIYAFMKEWNNYLWPLITLQSKESQTLTLFVSSLSSAYYVDYGKLMVAVVIATLPTVVVFMTMQKHFVQGILGSSK